MSHPFPSPQQPMTSQKRNEVIVLKRGTYRKSNDKRLAVAKKMPPLKRIRPGDTYSTESDQVLHWLTQQPPLMMFLFDKLAANGCIRYDPNKKEWVGVDYAD